MARPLRSLAALQSSIAGPSSVRPLAPIFRPSSLQNQKRTAFNMSGWDRFLPNLPRWKSDESDEKPTATDTPATTTSTSVIASEAGAEAEASPSSTGETGGLFDELVHEESDKGGKRRRRRGTDIWKEHRYSSAYHKVSHRKLNDLSRQIAGLPIDEAIVQMQFSEKRPSSWIKSTLALARDHAVDKKLNRDKLIVAETWVAKGRKISRLDIKGRGKYGIKHHPSAAIHVVLREGKTKSELLQEKFQKDLRRVRSAGIVREDGVIRRKVVSGWTW